MTSGMSPSRHEESSDIKQEPQTPETFSVPHRGSNSQRKSSNTRNHARQYEEDDSPDELATPEVSIGAIRLRRRRPSGDSIGRSVDEDDISQYEAPARATDLEGLPPTFIDCASAEPFRDEIVIFASRLWAAGVCAELHVWPGGPHGYDRIAPDAPMSKQAREARLAWLRRVFTGTI